MWVWYENIERGDDWGCSCVGDVSSCEGLVEVGPCTALGGHQAFL